MEEKADDGQILADLNRDEREEGVAVETAGEENRETGETGASDRVRPIWQTAAEEIAAVPAPEAPVMANAVPKKGGKGKMLGILFLVVLVAGAGYFVFNKIISGGGGTGGGKKEIIYWGLWEPETVMSGIIADYEREHPNVKISYRMHQKDDYRVRLDNKLSSNASDSPDIFRIHANWLPMFSGRLAAVPAETAKKLELDSAYFDIYKKSLTKNSQWLAVPLMYDGLALFYNEDILNAALKKAPRTWWGLRELAKELTVKDEDGKIQTAGVALGTTNNVDHWSDILGLMIRQNGADPTKTDSKLMEDVLTFYSLFYSEDKVWDETLPSSTHYFGSGRLAFYFAPSWRVFNLREINPNLKMAVTAVPQLPKITAASAEEAEREGVELTRVNWASFWVEGVAKNSKNSKEAWEFLSYLAGRESLSRLYQGASQIRDFGEIYPRKDLAAGLTENPLLKPFVEGADSAETWYLTGRTFDAGLNDQMIKYFEDAINKISRDGRTAAEVTESLGAGVNQLLDKYQASK